MIEIMGIIIKNKDKCSGEVPPPPPPKKTISDVECEYCGMLNCGCGAYAHRKEKKTTTKNTKGFGRVKGEKPVVTYPEACYHCYLCVKECPVDAIWLRSPLVMTVPYK